ncbi:cyclodeaminase/cyclohydrolase family protein [Eggerthellaceae bacterium 24-137]
MLDTEFIDALASKAPTPGGGGASAYAGALASALASMVGNLTVGKKKYAEVEERVQSELLELDDTRLRLLELVQADADAFAPLAAAYGMPRGTDEEAAAQKAALQHALVDACEVPLEIMRQCVQVVESCVFLTKHGSVMAVSDAGAGAVLAKAALLAASLNVRINIGSMDDAARAAAYRDEMEDLIAAGSALADDVYEDVVRRLG